MNDDSPQYIADNFVGDVENQDESLFNSFNSYKNSSYGNTSYNSSEVSIEERQIRTLKYDITELNQQVIELEDQLAKSEESRRQREKQLETEKETLQQKYSLKSDELDDLHRACEISRDELTSKNRYIEELVEERTRLVEKLEEKESDLVVLQSQLKEFHRVEEELSELRAERDILVLNRSNLGSTSAFSTSTDNEHLGGEDEALSLYSELLQATAGNAVSDVTSSTLRQMQEALATVQAEKSKLEHDLQASNREKMDLRDEADDSLQKRLAVEAKFKDFQEKKNVEVSKLQQKISLAAISPSPPLVIQSVPSIRKPCTADAFTQSQVPTATIGVQAVTKSSIANNLPLVHCATSRWKMDMRNSAVVVLAGIALLITFFGDLSESPINSWEAVLHRVGSRMLSKTILTRPI